MFPKFSDQQATAFFTTTIVVALSTCPVSFSMGAYGEIFYYYELRIWIASIAALFAAVVIRKTTEGASYFTWWGTLLLAVPTLALTDDVWQGQPEFYDFVIDIALLLSIPYIAYILLRVVARESEQIQGSGFQIWLFVGFLTLNTTSYLAGYYNGYYLTCQDFTIAGDEAPATCWKVPDALSQPLP